MANTDRRELRKRRVRRRRLMAGLAVVASVALAAVALTGGSHRRGAARGARSASPAGTAAPPTASSAAPTAAWVIAENNRPGTPAWGLGGSGPKRIEGWADRTSVAAGDPVGLHVSSPDGSFHVEAYRMGWYGGAQARLVWTSPQLPGGAAPPASTAPGTNMVETRWPVSVSLPVDGAWPPGFYLLKLVPTVGKQRYVPLTVRDDNSRAAFVIQQAVTTWQAYNDWGGYDLYAGKDGRGTSFAKRARVVSFDRPYALGDGAGDLGNELPLVQHVEKEGLDVTYWTDVDLHQHPELLLAHKALMSPGHDEYWSTAMRNGAERARDAGVNIAFLGANAVFRHIRLEDSASGAARHEVDYKDARSDPLYGKNNAEVTVDWRSPPVARPEANLVGDFYECNPVKADMVVFRADSWVYAGTGLGDGDRLPDLVGSEYDRYTKGVGAPADLEVLAHSPLKCHGRSSNSDMTYYTAPSGAGVFATGTNVWVASLGQDCNGRARPCAGDAVRQITDNVLAAFGQGPAGTAHPSVPNTDHLPSAPAIPPSEERHTTTTAVRPRRPATATTVTGHR